MIITLLQQGRTPKDKRPTLSAADVQRKLEERDLLVSKGTITKEAYRLGIVLTSGPRAGVPGIGRPRGPGKKYSPNRDNARRLRAEGLSLTAIGAELGLTRQGVAKLLSDGGEG